MTAPPLTEVLLEARRLGLLGPGPVEDHVTHALGFVDAAPSPPVRFLDLGSGAGIPGLALVLSWPAARGVLLDGSARRVAFLRRAVLQLGIEGRAEVLEARAEVAGHDARWRERFDLVVARGFGPPATTAECGAPFLAPGGALLVSDPPDGVERWPADGLALLGLAPGPPGAAVRRLDRVAACPPHLPRRRPGKPPLF